MPPSEPDAEDFDAEDEDADPDAGLRALAAMRRCRPLPDDLLELYERVRNAAMLRGLCNPVEPPVLFERFEAFDVSRGSMGMVIKARDPTCDRMVAIKLWIPSGREANEALLADAWALAELSHPNVVTIDATGQWRERVYFVMEWIEGVNGHTWLEQPRAWQEVCGVFVEPAKGLAAAHDVGILHRDFKPSNLLIGDDSRVVVADFCVTDSLVELAGDDEHRSLATMAPERLRGGSGDARSDQFSFCAVLWEALYGVRPFDGESGEALLGKMERGELCEPGEAEVPPWLSVVVRKGLAVDPAQRYRDMHQLVDALLDVPPEPEGDYLDVAEVSRAILEDVDPPDVDLLSGRPWVCWGPAIEHPEVTNDAVDLVIRRSKRPAGEIDAALRWGAQPKRYVLIERLHVTDHAVVYAGIDCSLACEIVVKIHRNSSDYATQRGLFESQTMARFTHSNIARIYDVGMHGSLMYSVIERCDTDLRKWHRGRTWAEIIARAIEAAFGLAHVHAAGYVHSDIKPTNILIKKGTAKLADFGAARKPGTGAHGGGTVGYMAPEMLDYGPSAASDVFALAVTLWVCLFDKMPFEPPPGLAPTGHAAILALAAQVEARNIRPPENVPEGLPPSVQQTLERALDPDPRERPTLDDFIRVLVAARDRETRRKRLRRRVPIVSGAVVVLFGLGFSVSELRHPRGTPGSIARTGVSAIDPWAGVEVAARDGDVNEAIGALYRAYDQIANMAPGESARAANAARRIAETLERQGKYADAQSVWMFATVLFERAGRMNDAEDARRHVKTGPS